MFTVDAASSNAPFSTKSSLQALLRSRRQILLNQCDKLPPSINGDTLMQNFLSVEEKNIVHLNSNGTINQSSPSSSALSTALKDVDHNGDFTYSQKLFHIADGNLYSIFSPLQGRSYGMKPSFLRKQKCTVQECRGRGRKVLRKGLKFHNFLPSESVTSEKDSTLLDDQWKVHSECKLREEHGTKQITVSNWFHSIKQPNDDDYKGRETSPQESYVGNNASLETHGNESPPCGDNLRTLNGSLETTVCEPNIMNHRILTEQETFKHPSICSISAIKTHTKPNNEKSNFLNNLLLSVANSQVGKPSLSSSSLSSPSPSPPAHHRIIICNGQKHRRKPEQTRRIVPYTKYLSIMEETETGPLDLSLHANSTPVPSINEVQYKTSSNVTNSIKSPTTESTTSFFIPQKRNSHYSITGKLDTRINSEKHHLPDIINGNYRHSPQSFHPKESAGYRSLQPSSTGQNKFLPNITKEPHYKLETCTSHNPPYIDSAKPGDIAKVVTSPKPRKRSQRSVIKKKLEDTFKQNGFLVKTKQVSDGEATFCKFRQLRKYTRYYLKSWQQHLPDEVHKMWKGFLPPKTVLPSISGTVSHTNDEPT